MPPSPSVTDCGIVGLGDRNIFDDDFLCAAEDRAADFVTPRRIGDRGDARPDPAEASFTSGAEGGATLLARMSDVRSWRKLVISFDIRL